MINYFNVFTDNTNAINNVSLYGFSELEKVDICRLLGAHLKYSGGYKFISKEDIPEAYGGANPLKSILTALDNLTLYRDTVIYNRELSHKDYLYFDKLYHISVDEDYKYYHIDLSAGDFKELCKDRTAMIEENRRVGEAMKFLLAHNCEFEYDGSRAKLKIPYENQFLHVGSQFGESSNRTFIRYDVYKVTTETKTVAIPKNN